MLYFIGVMVFMGWAGAVYFKQKKDNDALREIAKESCKQHGLPPPKW